MVDLRPSQRRTPNPVAVAWGESLKARRVLLRLPQDVLSEVTGIPQTTISKIENGRFTPSLDMLIKLAQGLGANPAELYQWPLLRDLPAMAEVAS